MALIGVQSYACFDLPPWLSSMVERSRTFMDREIPGWSSGAPLGLGGCFVFRPAFAGRGRPKTGLGQQSTLVDFAGWGEWEAVHELVAIGNHARWEVLTGLELKPMDSVRPVRHDKSDDAKAGPHCRKAHRRPP